MPVASMAAAKISDAPATPQRVTTSTTSRGVTVTKTTTSPARMPAAGQASYTAPTYTQSLGGQVTYVQDSQAPGGYTQVVYDGAADDTPAAPGSANPYARGRVPAGTMPHPSARFEATTTVAAPSPDRATSAGNPYARGRVPAGTMPHPSARFESEPAEIVQHQSGSRGHNPPGGKGNFVFG